VFIFQFHPVPYSSWFFVHLVELILAIVHSGILPEQRTLILLHKVACQWLAMASYIGFSGSDVPRQNVILETRIHTYNFILDKLPACIPWVVSKLITLDCCKSSHDAERLEENTLE
jgi:hypothetical protein